MTEHLDKRSTDIAAMQPYWVQAETIMGGTKTMRAAGQAFLPKFANETAADYKLRVDTAPFENIFADIVSSLASRPFSKEVALKEATASKDIEAFIEDVDGAGNHIHRFAADLFDAGIQDAIGWVLVDHHSLPDNSTLADKRNLGARPYFVQIAARDMIAVYSDVIKGREAITHFRFCETVAQPDGFGEKTVSRIRVFDREPLRDDNDKIIDYAAPTFEVYEKTVSGTGDKKTSWNLTDSGSFGLPEIPIVPFITGRRKGLSWEIIPPMQDAADLQIEHYQLGSDLKYAQKMTCFAMLAGNGIEPPVDSKGNPIIAPVGPKAVLYAPPNGDGQSGEWKFIEPTTASLKFLAERLADMGEQIRELGRQPLTAGSGNITVIAAAFASQKANSAAQQWAFNLKDTLENALKFVAMWTKDTSTAEVIVHTDFDVGSGGDKDMDTLGKARAAGDISRKTYLHELKRRGTLSAEFSEMKDEQELIEEVPSDESGLELTEQ